MLILRRSSPDSKMIGPPIFQAGERHRDSFWLFFTSDFSRVGESDSEDDVTSSCWEKARRQEHCPKGHCLHFGLGNLRRAFLPAAGKGLVTLLLGWTGAKKVPVVGLALGYMMGGTDTQVAGAGLGTVGRHRGKGPQAEFSIPRAQR